MEITNIHEAESQLSGPIDRALSGEEVIILLVLGWIRSALGAHIGRDIPRGAAPRADPTSAGRLAGTSPIPGGRGPVPPPRGGPDCVRPRPAGKMRRVIHNIF
jgi:hypothetical protein